VLSYELLDRSRGTEGHQWQFRLDVAHIYASALKHSISVTAFNRYLRLVNVAPMPILPAEVAPEPTRVCWPPDCNVTTAMSGKSRFDSVLEIGHSIEHDPQQRSGGIVEADGLPLRRHHWNLLPKPIVFI
jgi:hypothetical protein